MNSVDVWSWFMAPKAVDKVAQVRPDTHTHRLITRALHDERSATNLPGKWLMRELKFSTGGYPVW